MQYQLYLAETGFERPYLLVKNNFDNGHLNSFGAEIYSNMLAEGIKEKIK